jgi:hypothetical protein
LALERLHLNRGDRAFQCGAKNKISKTFRAQVVAREVSGASGLIWPVESSRAIWNASCVT